MNTKRYSLTIVGIALIGLTAFAAVAVALGDDAGSNDDSTCLVGTVDCVDADLGGDTSDETPLDPSGSTCLVGTVDCVDADLGGDRLDGEAIAQIEQQARGLLGMNEIDLPADVRIGRRGAEQMMLTEDYVLGRMTVSVEEIDDSGYRVVDVTVELPNGTATYELQAG